MEWIAIPLGHRRDGRHAGRRLAGSALRRTSLPTVLALSGGIVVAVAIFDVMPEAVELMGDPHGRRC